MILSPGLALLFPLGSYSLSSTRLGWYPAMEEVSRRRKDTRLATARRLQ